MTSSLEGRALIPGNERAAPQSERALARAWLRLASARADGETRSRAASSSKLSCVVRSNIGADRTAAVPAAASHVALRRRHLQPGRLLRSLPLALPDRRTPHCRSLCGSPAARSGGRPGRTQRAGRDPPRLELVILRQRSPAERPCSDTSECAIACTTSWVVDARLAGGASPLEDGVLHALLAGLVDLEPAGLSPLLQPLAQPISTASLLDSLHSPRPFSSNRRRARP